MCIQVWWWGYHSIPQTPNQTWLIIRIPPESLKKFLASSPTHRIEIAMGGQGSVLGTKLGTKIFKHAEAYPHTCPLESLIVKIPTCLLEHVSMCSSMHRPISFF